MKDPSAASSNGAFWTAHSPCSAEEARRCARNSRRFSASCTANRSQHCQASSCSMTFRAPVGTRRSWNSRHARSGCAAITIVPEPIRAPRCPPRQSPVRKRSRWPCASTDSNQPAQRLPSRMFLQTRGMGKKWPSQPTIASRNRTAGHTSRALPNS